MCTNRTRAWEKPSARPASTKARSFRLSTGARAMRANGAMAVSAMAKTRFCRSGPSSATTIRPRMRLGNDSITSITCITNRSVRPPT